jgi:hypothetical protein
VIDDQSKISNSISSTSIITRKNCTETSTNNDKTSDLLHTGGSLIVKFKRLRQSELSLLNDEAENFMFPQKKENENDENHTESDTDDDRHTTSEHTANDNQSITLVSYSSEGEQRTSKKQQDQHKRDETMERLLLADVTSSCCRTRRRRNQLEAFLNDNNDYYKFEDPGSRLRFQEAPIQSPSTTPLKNKTVKCKTEIKTEEYDHHSEMSAGVAGIPRDGMGDNQTQPNKKKKWHLIQDLDSEDVKRQKFAFERVPISEPWYDAFHRQDYGVQRVYSYFGNTGNNSL